MNSTINIKENLDGTFTVRYDRKTAQGLGYDEMIGLITQISMPKERKCLQWLRTKEEIEERKREIKKRFDDNRKECLVELFACSPPYQHSPFRAIKKAVRRHCLRGCFGRLKKRAIGIEPTYPAWKASVLPLNYARKKMVREGFEPSKRMRSRFTVCPRWPLG